VIDNHRLIRARKHRKVSVSRECGRLATAIEPIVCSGFFASDHLRDKRGGIALDGLLESFFHAGTLAPSRVVVNAEKRSKKVLYYLSALPNVIPVDRRTATQPTPN